MATFTENQKDGLKTAAWILLLALSYWITDKLDIRDYVSVAFLLLFAGYVIRKSYLYFKFRKEVAGEVMLPAYNDRYRQTSSRVLGILTLVITPLCCWKFQVINPFALCMFSLGILLIVNSFFVSPQHQLSVSDNFLRIVGSDTSFRLEDLKVLEIQTDELILQTTSGTTERVGYLLLNEEIAKEIVKYISERNTANSGLVFQNNISVDQQD